MTVADALLAIAAGDHRAALDSAASESAGSRLAAALVDHLADRDQTGVYEEPTAFEAFIDGGGNPALYARTIDHLAGLHARIAPASVVDIGCGDGRVTAAVLHESTRRVDLVEPSTALLALATRRLATVPAEVVGHAAVIGEVLDRGPDAPSWQLAMSTFALAAIEPVERANVLERLALRAERLVLVEFDVPGYVDRSADHASYVAARYEIGLAEYVDAPEAVSGFLLPVMVGQFDPIRPRHTFEQPIDDWVRDLAEAGWTTVARTRVADYWWAPAVAVEATSPDRNGD